MIRKCFKLNTCFLDVLKNSAALQTIDQKWIVRNPSRAASVSCINSQPKPVPINTNKVNTNRSVQISKPNPKRNERGDAESFHSESEETVVSETPVKTELFEVKGPNESAFLIEVQAKDLEEVKRELVSLKGEYFRFDKSVIELFTIKCILRVESPCKRSVSDQVRLSRVHAISSGCDEVYSGEGKFFFVSFVDRTVRAKKILQKLGYNVLEILYRFQPREKVCLDEHVRDVCYQFVKAVEMLPKVISVTHNL